MDTVERSDETIARSVQTGEVEAFGELVVRYENKLKRYAQKFLSQKEDVEDLVQEVFIKAYTNIQSFDINLRFSPWIYRIAHNIFVNELRRKSRYGFNVFDADTILPLIPAKETADNNILKEEIKKEMEFLLKNLSDKYREIVVLHYFQELSYKEISDILQIPTTTVGVRMLRAKSQLKKEYQKIYE